MGHNLPGKSPECHGGVLRKLDHAEELNDGTMGKDTSTVWDHSDVLYVLWERTQVLLGIIVMCCM